MDLKETILSFNLPKQYEILFNSINFDATELFVYEIIKLMKNKYGEENIIREIQLDNANSPISNNLTHIIEVGGLKVINDNNLYSANTNIQQLTSVVGFILNCALALELSKSKLYFDNEPLYYNGDSLRLIVSRLNKHLLNGLEFSQGFSVFAEGMIDLNLRKVLQN